MTRETFMEGGPGAVRSQQRGETGRHGAGRRPCSLLVPLGIGELASHRDDPQYVAFALALAGMCGCGYFGLKAWGKLSSADPPVLGWWVVAGGFVLSALLVTGAAYAIAVLETPEVAVRVLASSVILPTGILVAFIVAMAVGMGGNEVLGYGVGLGILVLMGWVLWLVLPSS